ncbi:MAG: hypothetical protein JOY87_00990 [Candidatus Eremiobacteraeota bacterium]|nr:hypothetical protein [Candidatus Eremiobacteraeota bacterium]
MNWRPTIYWGSLAAVFALIALALTRWITAVHLESDKPFAIVFDEHAPLVHEPTRSTLLTATPERRRLPSLVITGYDEVVLVVTPATRGIHIVGYRPDQLSCAAPDRISVGASTALITEALHVLQLHPVTAVNSTDAALAGEAAQIGDTLGLKRNSWPITDIIVPASLEQKIKAVSFGQGAIRCRFTTPLPASPTFTDRSITIVTLASQSSATILDVSALADISDLRFFGGLVLPWAGDRTRIFDHSDELVSVEWSDATAQEERDVILVIIGALAAIAASTALEALRPIVERLTHVEY